ncbi:MAG: PRTRC system protein C [Tunicatimonas sp.]|uniref:PRTRC system protein C n=1 Tax=Tunicatimonas sp. TaxID=1940096 RepID=UPI003C76ACFE
MIEAIQITREFRYQGITLTDLGENFTPEYIKDFYAGTYPALTNAEIQDNGISDDKHIYTFSTKVATKG